MAGKVYLIGGGPGDPGLITVKGLRYLQKADVIVHDRLVDERLLSKARHGAELIFVGKGPGERVMEQDDINRCLVARGLEGKVVVRLKGGDPFVFGRGGEEAQALSAAGVTFEVVPGVTSAIAAPAYAGIPLTHRDMASSFTVVTGSEDPSKGDSNVRWDELARSGGTLVVVMGWNTLENITRTLKENGMESSTPVALVRWGTEPRQRTVTGTLGDIAPRGKEAGLGPPMVAVIGPVAKLRDEVRWFDNRPLFGKRILVTRSRTQASALAEMLAEEGAQPIEVPAIEISPVEDYSPIDGAIATLHNYSWVIFTSANGVEAFFSRIHALKLDSREFKGIKVGAIGPATATALSQQGIRADMVPSEYVSESVVQAMETLDLRGAHVLLPGSDIGRGELADGLGRLGAQVDRLTVYRTAASESSRGRARSLMTDDNIDLVTFTSSSTVRNLLSLLDGNAPLLHGARVACIGPITARAAQEAGLEVDIVAQEYTITGLVRALREYFDGQKVG